MRQKWNKEKIMNIAKKYNTRNEFKQGNISAYKAAKYRKIMSEVCKHMTVERRSWTNKEIEEEAKKYNARKEFYKYSKSPYQLAYQRGILDEVCKHMTVERRKWTNKEIFEEAKKYNTRVEFQKNSKAYKIAHKRNILDEACGHMKSGLYAWSIDDIKKEALKYNSRLEFQNNSPNAYAAAFRRKIVDSVCGHMQKPINESIVEKELLSAIKEIYPKAQKLRDKQVNIPDKPYIKRFEIDIYIPELRKGIEFDGSYWHSFEGLKRGRPNWENDDLKNYHKIKDEYFNNKGIKILHIDEEDWKNNQDKEIKKCLNFLEA